MREYFCGIQLDGETLKTIPALYEKQINLSNPMGYQGEIVRGFASIINSMWRSNGAVFPSKFKGIMGKHFSQFSGHHQQDA